MSPFDPDLDELWDEEQEKESWAKLAFSFLLLGFLKGAGEVGGNKRPEQLLNFFRREALKSRSLDYAAKTIGTTKGALQRLIDDALAKGWGSKKLATEINKMYGKSMGYRSLRIARTQLTDAVTDGNLSALIAGGHREKEWSTVLDGRERHSHHNADGQRVGIYDQFRLVDKKGRVSYGMRPGDPNFGVSEICNCRCDVVQPGLSSRQRRAHGQIFLRVHGSLERQFVLSLRRQFRVQRDSIISSLTP